MRSRWVALAVVVATTVGLRVAHVLALRSTPWFDFLAVDPEFYDAWARRIAAGDWLGDRPFYMDPLYPYLLGAFYRVVGRDLLLARLLNVALSAGACLLIARIGWRLGGWTVALLAASGFALYAPDVFSVGELDKTCLSVLLTAGFLALALEPGWLARFGCGVVLGLASITRGNFLALAPLATLAFALDGRAARAGAATERSSGRIPAGIAGAAIFAGGFALALAPVALRNHRVSGEWVVTTAQAGQNFYVGNNPTNPYGAFGVLPFVRANPHFEEIDFRAEAERRAGRAMSAGEVSRFWFARALEHMQEAPGFAVRSFARKLALFWNDFEISDSQDQYIVERASWVLRLPLVGFGWIAPLALLGALAGFRTSYGVRLLAGFSVVYCVSVVAFFLFARYRIQVVAALLPLAALGIVEIVSRARERDVRRLAAAAALLVLGWSFSFHTIGIFSRSEPAVQEMRLRHLAVAYRSAGRVDESIDALREAVAQCAGGCRLALADLADLYLATGRVAEGADELRRLARTHPENPEAARQLERLLDPQRPMDSPGPRVVPSYDAAGAAR